MDGSIDSHQFVHVHELLLLLVQLVVLDLQNHLQALQLLLQVERVGVLLQTRKTKVKIVAKLLFQTVMVHTTRRHCF